LTHKLQRGGYKFLDQIERKRLISNFFGKIGPHYWVTEEVVPNFLKMFVKIFPWGPSITKGESSLFRIPTLFLIIGARCGHNGSGG